ncbi:hypothetical protein M8C21_014117, partial [Ambrosia artemisiifolia]
TEVRGWRKTGRPKQLNPSFTELKTVKCIIHGPQLEDIYSIAEMSKSSTGDKTMPFASSLNEEGMTSGTRSEIIDEAMEEIIDKQYVSGDEMFGKFVATFNEIMMEESDPYTHEQNEIRESDLTAPVPRFGEWDDNDPASDPNYTPIFNRIRSKEQDEIQESDLTAPVPRFDEWDDNIFNRIRSKKIMLAVKLDSKTKRHKMVKALMALQGIMSVDFNKKEGILTVIGNVDPETVIEYANKIADTEILSVEPAKEDDGSPKKKKSACSVM